jgi:flagellar basal-body rod modification protein FlgD
MTISNVAPINPNNAVTAANTSANAASNAAATAAATAAVSTLSINDFLTLMTAQLKNQDPSQPLDPSTFVTQLAQFGTVSGIDSMQTSLSSLSSTLLANQALSSAGLVGHSVLTQASSAQYSAGQSMAGAVQAPTGSSGVVVDVNNASGQMVQQLTLGAGSGMTAFSWDGSTLSGAAAPSGSYSFQAIAQVNGASVAAPIYLSGTVSSISLNSGGSGGVTVNTPQLGSISLANIQQID